jgi:hypothetical protein
MWLGDYVEDFTAVVCMFTTHASTGAPVAPLSAFEAADVRIYKNGNAAEKTTTNGVTMTSPFDSITGLHCVTIDTSNDTGDGGFWVAGAVYTLVLSPDETVDSVAVAKVIGQFGIKLYPTPTAIEVADALLDRDMSTGTDSGSTTVRTVRQALRFLRNKWSISGTTLTVTKENDTTASWTAQVTGTAGADPITSSDPAGP